MEGSRALPKVPRVPLAPEGPWQRRAPAQPAPGADAAGCRSPAAKPSPAPTAETSRLGHLNVLRPKGSLRWLLTH